MDRHSIALQYGTSDNLAARIALHQRFSTNPYGLQRWVFDRLRLVSGQRVLEIACGTGRLWLENADRIPSSLGLALTDMSLGMLDTTRTLVSGADVRVRYAACALPDLPFPGGTFDLVIANHMLYHVADLERGLTEIRRVLRRGGSLLAATNGREHLREIKQLMEQFGIGAGNVSAAFTLENGYAPLQRVFGSVGREDYDDALRVDDAELLLGYIASMAPRARAIVAERQTEMRAAIEAHISRDGAFHVAKSTGAFLVRNS